MVVCLNRESFLVGNAVAQYLTRCSIFEMSSYDFFLYFRKVAARVFTNFQRDKRGAIKNLIEMIKQRLLSIEARAFYFFRCFQRK